MGCKKSGNECQFNFACFSIRNVQPHEMYANKNAVQGHVETERNVCDC